MQILHQRTRDRKHQKLDQWLVLIGALKIVQGILFTLLGFGALKLLHKDLVDVIAGWFIDMRFDPESRIVNLLLDKVALINEHRLKQISIAIFCYAALDFIEGTGLVLEKVWAEYFTLVLTASFLPWECFELVRHFTRAKLAFVGISLLIVFYLLFVVQARVRERTIAVSSS